MKQIVIGDRFSTFTQHVGIHETELLEAEAEYALKLAGEWGLVLAVDDGEDSAGRSKRRSATPAEVVTRAFDVAKLAFDEARKRQLVITMPDASELVGAANDSKVRQIIDRIQKRLVPADK